MIYRSLNRLYFVFHIINSLFSFISCFFNIILISLLTDLEPPVSVSTMGDIAFPIIFCPPALIGGATMSFKNHPPSLDSALF